MILAYVERHPGVRFHELKRELEIPHGTLLHHLKVLDQQGLLVLDRAGRRLRLRLPGQRILASLPTELAPLAALVRQRPGITVLEASRELGWARWITRYRAGRLASAGAVRFEGDTKPRHLVPTDTPPPAPDK